LVYDAANIANHFYTLRFLKKACSREFEDRLGFHIAKKKIKHIDLATNEVVAPTKPNGIKLELFIFDIFPFLGGEDKFAVFSVPRSSEFSPLKNAPGTGVDCPETSRRDIFRQSTEFLHRAGVVVIGSAGGVEKFTLKDDGKEVLVEEVAVEVSPLVSYDGEGLESVSGRRIEVIQPLYISSLSSI
jgi:UDP-N-acetylglucosamine/UDP-N-acetylgalactosamine diphosphorylase